MSFHYLQIGALGDVYLGQNSPGNNTAEYPYRCRVLVRTGRGVELATVIRRASEDFQSERLESATIVRIVRKTTEEDELLIRRLQRHKREAVEAARAELGRSGSRSLLLDVDQVFDGGSLVMHFLGPVDEIAQSITAEVTEQYESIVRTRHFAKLLQEGCGPDCGTGEAGGCGTAGGCAGCAVKACKTAIKNEVN